MIRLSCGIFSLVLVLGGVSLVPAADPSHSRVREIPVEGLDGSTLQTLALLPDGTVAALVAPSRYGGNNSGAAPSGVRLYDDSGREVATWRVDFHAQSIAAGPDGRVYVGGSGRLARFDRQGTLLESVELPHLKSAIADTDKLREQALQLQKQYEESNSQAQSQFAEQKQDLQNRLDELRAKDEQDLTAAEKRRITRFERQLAEFDTIVAQFAVPSVEDLQKQLTDRLRMVNGVTVTDRDIFVVTGETTGFGYSVWRMNHQFQDSQQVLAELRGCCGQMDVRAHGDELYVAENCSHRVGRYSRDGEKLGAFGQRAGRPPVVEVSDAESKLAEILLGTSPAAPPAANEDAAGFGGCCNPMNVWVTDDNLVYTAESEGIIRCFTTRGEYRGLVGEARLTGGCKNVAVAVAPGGRTVYFCDQPGQKIIVLARTDAAGESARN